MVIIVQLHPISLIGERDSNNVMCELKIIDNFFYYEKYTKKILVHNATLQCNNFYLAP